MNEHKYEITVMTSRVCWLCYGKYLLFAEVLTTLPKQIDLHEYILGNKILNF